MKKSIFILFIFGTLSANAQWNTTGNAGTIPGTNFLGTTDTVALQLDVNGKKAGFINYAKPYNVSLGNWAGNSLIGGYYCTFIGYAAGQNTTTAAGNVSSGPGGGTSCCS